jgi:threonine/homoserine/homoserine lactone efflux protein
MLLSLPSLLPFVLFAFVASITPGPTNILVLSSSARFGVRATLPIILGACSGAALLLLLVGFGSGETIMRHVVLRNFLQWVGTFWLTCLAWKIYRAPVEGIVASSSGYPSNHPGWREGAALQVINPKSWMVALSVVSVFNQNASVPLVNTLLLSSLFFIVALPCLIFWAAIGSGTATFLQTPGSIRRFNTLMALMLMAAAWIGLLM